jgi:hypothetical protein
MRYSLIFTFELFLRKKITSFLGVRETKADTLKKLRPIGERDQELEKRLVQEELT